MSNKLPVWETIVTAVLLIVAGFGIGTTVQKRVDKGSGDLTLSNYTDYLQVSCGVNSGTGAGSTATYSYTVFVSAHENYAIRDLVLSYTITGGGASVSCRQISRRGKCTPRGAACSRMRRSIFPRCATSRSS